MSYWFLPHPLSEDALKAALDGHELPLPGEGLADLGRTQGPEQIAAWLRQLYPQALPEDIAIKTEHFWRLGHELLADDTLVVQRPDGAYMIGEITGAYRRESREQGMSHILPVAWHHAQVPAESVPKLRIYSNCPGLTEITDEEVLLSLKPYIPLLRKSGGSFFRWLGIVILIFELIYFWPKS